jgi:uncharacterized membrane protein HdeD (DUF308 family)
MKIWGIFLIIVSLMNLILCYFVATDKIKPSKSSQILYYIIASMFLFTSALRAFSR